MKANQNEVLLAIDQGTTSTRAILFSVQGKPLLIKQKELALQYPNKGWVEQRPEDIWNDTLWTCRGVVSEAYENNMIIAGIGITNQRETTLIWDRVTGKPIYNAIVWQDRRTADLCAELKNAGYEKTITEKTGLLLDPYFSATKIVWILEHVAGARSAAEKGRLAFGTIDSFILWQLTEGRVHATDITNASRTLLFNIGTQQWDDDLLKLFNIPSGILPEVKDNVASFGATVPAPAFLDKTFNIGGMAGDQHAALIGQGCFKPGMIKATYGTGCFAVMNTGTDRTVSHNKLLTTIAYRIDGEICYALEGSIFTAGSAVQWLRDNIGLLMDARESEAVATSVPDSNAVYFVPAFTGLGAPYWNPNARGAIIGLSRESNSAHIVRAALEAQGYQSRDLIVAMAADCANPDFPGVLRIDGGMVKNTFVCQFLADILDRTIEVPQVMECTAWGAAGLAGVQSGLFNGLDDIAGNWTCAQRYTSQMQSSDRKKLYTGWKQAIKAVLN